MKLSEELAALCEAWRPPTLHVHKPETAEELYDQVAARCVSRAAEGCSSLTLHWEGVEGTNREEWEEQHKVCLQVVEWLKEEGLVASCTMKCPDLYCTAYGDWEQPVGEHYINVRWPSKVIDTWKQKTW